MSAAPVPTATPEPAPEQAPEPTGDDAGWALLEALRRKLDDHGSQNRKTQQQVNQLAESIGALVAEQRRRSRWLNLNSFVAYLLFTVVVGAGFFMMYRSRANELVESRDSAIRERDLAVRRADDAEAKIAARDDADTRAWEVYQLLEAGNHSEAAGKLATLTVLPLTRTERAVLAARAHETQVMEVDAALKIAATAFRAGRYGDVIAPLEAALVSEPAGSRAAVMHYYLGVARAKANDLTQAVAHLRKAVAADVDQDDARFQLASALDRSGQYARARTEYTRFATAFPQSTHAVFAMRRSATLARMPAVAPTAEPAAEPAAKPAAQPAEPKPAEPKPAEPKPAPAAAPGLAPPNGIVPKVVPAADGAPAAAKPPAKPAAEPLAPAR